MKRDYLELREAIEEMSNFAIKAQTQSGPTFALPNSPTPPIPPNFNVIPVMRSALQEYSVRQNMGFVQNFSELEIALQEELSQITLKGDIIATKDLSINHDVTINLNGHSFVSDRSLPGARALEISRGEVTLTGSGKIFAMGEASVAIKVSGAMSASVPDYTTLIIDENVRIYAPDGTGILVASNLGVAYGVKVIHRGEIFAKDGIRLSHTVQGRDINQPELYIKDGSRIIADEKVGVAMSSEGLGNWQIGATKVAGAKGFTISEGEVSFSNTIISTKGPAIEATLPPAHPKNRRLPIQMKIEGGIFVSNTDYAITGTCRLNRLELSGGEFWGAGGGILPKILRPAERTNSIVRKGNKDLSTEFISANTHSNWGKMPTYFASVASKQNSPSTELNEHQTLRLTLLQAIEELRQLRAEDYVGGFEKFSAELNRAERVLANKTASLKTVRDTTERLLASIDNLEALDESTLSDDELDELFYDELSLEDLTEPDDFLEDEFAEESFAEKQPVGTMSKWINELDPIESWTTGTALIDETTPFYDPEVVRQRHSAQAVNSHSWWKSFSVGIHTGFTAFHKNRIQTRY